MFTGKQLCWSLFLIKLEEPRNFIKKKLQHKCFSVKFSKFLKTLFLQNTPGGYFWKYLMNSLFVAYENDEWCHFEVRVGSSAFIFFYCVCFCSFYFFLFFLFFVNSTTCWGTDVNLSILRKRSEVIPMFLSEISRGELLQPYLVINVTGLVQFGKNLSYILPSLAS